MKFNGKMMSVCALLVATTACYASEEKHGQRVQFSIKNDSKMTIHGGIYVTTAGGNVIDQRGGKYISLNPTECAIVTINRSTNRKSEYNRLIFSTDEPALKNRIEHNKDSSFIATTKIPQNFFENNSLGFECYSIKGTKKIKIVHTSSGEKCEACADPVGENAVNNLSGVSLPDVNLEKSTWQRLQSKFKRKPKVQRVEGYHRELTPTEVQYYQQQSPEFNEYNPPATMHMPSKDRSGSMEPESPYIPRKTID